MNECMNEGGKEGGKKNRRWESVQWIELMNEKKGESRCVVKYSGTCTYLKYVKQWYCIGNYFDWPSTQLPQEYPFFLHRSDNRVSHFSSFNLDFTCFSGQTDLGNSVEYARCFGHPVVNLSLPSACVNVSQERGDHREICGEAIINVLLFHRQVLGWYYTIGGHLERVRVTNQEWAQELNEGYHWCSCRPLKTSWILQNPS